MKDILNYSDNVDSFNTRVRQIQQRCRDLFNVDVDVEEINIEVPQFYDSFADQYFTSVEHQVIYNLNALLTQLSRYHIVAPKSFVVFNFDWHEVNSCLQSIEQRLAQY
ncbi:hypothetical protein [Limosilactobacillus reuteri]|uniref:hypothetical protein n=1 Tax=Limosilactobacillus reuteri TaxID=1598 RepID=UPI001E4C107A|nr:hypothetical protein [Limosilactobacillus reuteri]MCC4501826.1 hypothetical protein [Limosilactobacillus reuteri]